MENENKYIKIIDKICSVKTPGKKMLQKLMYLIERKGVKLDLNYSIHFFGPYSSNLDNIIHILDAKQLLHIDTSGRTHLISRTENNDIDFNFEPTEDEQIEYVINNFLNKTARELEAITTLDYVYDALLHRSGTDNEIVDEVIKIKGSKFKRDYLQTELEILKEYEYIS